MTERSKETLEERKMKEMEKKAKRLILFESMKKFLEEEIEKLKEEFRDFVEKYGTPDEKGRKFWERELVRVTLTPTPRYEVDKDKFIGVVGLQAAVDYLKVDRQKVLAGIKIGKIPLSEEELKKIEKVEYGKPKVSAVYLGKEIKKIEGFLVFESSLED